MYVVPGILPDNVGQNVKVMLVNPTKSAVVLPQGMCVASLVVQLCMSVESVENVNNGTKLGLVDPAKWQEKRYSEARKVDMTLLCGGQTAETGYEIEDDDLDDVDLNSDTDDKYKGQAVSARVPQ